VPIHYISAADWMDKQWVLCMWQYCGSRFHVLLLGCEGQAADQSSKLGSRCGCLKHKVCCTPHQQCAVTDLMLLMVMVVVVLLLLLLLLNR
jgi:hypothetical protein